MGKNRHFKKEHGAEYPSDGWSIKTLRPEERYGDPLLYFDVTEAEKYARSSGMKNAQHIIANRILELLPFQEQEIKSMLDMGCGPGYTSEIYKAAGYEVTGLDVSSEMLKYSTDRTTNTKLGDMRDLESLFNSKTFDAVVSASAMQWVKETEDMKKIARGIIYVLKENGSGVIQFYPQSEQELIKIAKIFNREGLITEVTADNPGTSKKINYLILRR